MDVVPATVSATSEGEITHPLLVIAALMTASFTVGFDTRVLSIGLQDLSGAFDLSFDQASWLGTFAAAPQVLIAPAVAWLAAVFGVRRVMIGPCLVYALVSFLIPFTHGFNLLVALHFVRGLLLGIFIPATIGITLRNLDHRYWLIGLAIYSMRIPLSQNLGVFLVGLYTEHVGLQWLYWQDVFLTPLVALLILLGTQRAQIDRAMLATSDWGGMLLLGSSMLMIYIALDQGERLDWFESSIVPIFLVGGGVLAISFLINEMVVTHPWAHVRVVMSRNRLLGLSSIVAFIAAGIPTSVLIPSFLETVAGLRPVEIGRLYIPFAILPLFCSTGIAWLFLRRVDARFGLIVGFSLMAAGSLLGSFVTSVWAVESFVLIVLLQIVGQGFALFSIIVCTVSNSNPKESTANSAYIQVVRLGGAELVISLVVTLLSKREQFHSNILGTYVTRSARATEEVLSKLMTVFQAASEKPTADALLTLSSRIRVQAFTLAYADCFLVAFWSALGGMALAALMVRAPRGPLTPGRKYRARSVRNVFSKRHLPSSSR